LVWTELLLHVLACCSFILQTSTFLYDTFMYKLVGEKPNLSQEFTIFVLCYLQRFWRKKCMTWDKWSVVKFCNDCWTFLASMLYVAMQRLDFSWIPMYFYVKKTYSWDFLFIYTIRASICSDLVISFSFLNFLDFSYFLKMFLYYISQDFPIIQDMVDAHQRSREPSGRTKICNTCFIWQLYLCNTSHNLFLCNFVLPNSHREITPHVKSPLREERGLACPEKSLPPRFASLE